MDKKSLVKILQADITSVQSIIQGFDGNGNVSGFEIDIALSKTKELLNELSILKTLIDENPSSNKPITTINSEPEKAVEQNDIAIIEPQVAPQPSFESVPETASETNTAASTIETTSPEPIMEEVNIPEIEENEPIAEPIKSQPIIEPATPIQPAPTVTTNEPLTDKPEIKTEPVVEQKTLAPETPQTNKAATFIAQGKTEIMADKFQNNAQSVNDMLSNFKKDQDLATLLINRPVTDLKKAIKINDRIWYINELFKKDADTFNITIDKVNGFNNLDEALEYLFTNFNWDQSQKSTISFLELVFRRFTR